MAEPKVGRWTIAGKELACPFCANGTFWERPTLMNTVGATFFKLDFANREASAMVCAKCSHILWFMDRPVPAREADPA